MSPKASDKKLGIDIGKLTDEDVGMSVCYVPVQARFDGKGGWLNHPDCEWGRISSWNDRYINVRFGNKLNTQACNPKDLFPEHMSSYVKRTKTIDN